MPAKDRSKTALPHLTASSNEQFKNLSLKDVVEARDMFHVHLMHKSNVVATAIGRYLIRNSDMKNGVYHPKKTFPRAPRRLDNSRVVQNFSWPCVLVFVNRWQDEGALIHQNGDNLIPKSIYMPDGRVIPICIVEAPKEMVGAVEEVDIDTLIFPANKVGGGFPAIIETQGETRVATIGCLVSDGHTVYALSNKHVTGEKSETVFTRRYGKRRRIGRASGKFMGKKPFSEMYPGWSGSNILVNNDVGLIEIDNIKDWKTEILGFGEIGRLFDLSTQNLSLDLIGKKVVGNGAVSGRMEGEIFGVFFRYRSVGGKEYVSDYLIGGPDGRNLNTHRGDSGTLWMIEETCVVKDSRGRPSITLEYRPIALHWGQFETQKNNDLERMAFAMATSLSNLCREMDVDIIRNWNTDQDYSWSKVGHFTIGNKAVFALSSTPPFAKLNQLMTYCQELIGLTVDDIPSSQDQGTFQKYKLFCPLADVPDIVWKTISPRPLDNPNHYADIDQKGVNGLTLIDMYKADPSTLNPKTWFDFYDPLHISDGNKGCLPFRARQIFRAMVAYLTAKDIIGFVCAAGVLGHYMGDACQPLHATFLHHGDPPDFDDGNIHTLYEDGMIQENANFILDNIDARITKQKSLAAEKIGPIGTLEESAKRVVDLMIITAKKLPPKSMVEVYNPLKGNDKKVKEALWLGFKDETVNTMARGSRYLAAYWEAAWTLGNGSALNSEVNTVLAMNKTQLKSLLKELYLDPQKFIPSVHLKDIKKFL
jgi:hypothetical protein